MYMYISNVSSSTSTVTIGSP